MSQEEFSFDNRFFCCYSNYLEVLAEKFNEQVYSRPLKRLLSRECVITPTGGVGDYLKLYLAEHNPIAANVETFFLEHFIGRVFAGVFGAEYHRCGEWFQPENMTLVVFAELMKNAAEYPELAPFLSGDDRTLKTYELSEEIARGFDRYQIYRSDVLEDWRQNRATAPDMLWQKRLFLHLEKIGGSARDVFFHRFEALPALPEENRLPERVNVFGVSFMPKLYLDFFHQLGRFTEVNFFYLNPCRGFWADLEAPKQSLKQGTGKIDGNPVLASLVQVGRSFFNAVSALPGFASGEDGDCLRDYLSVSGPDDPLQADMLHWLQTDIFEMYNRSKNPDPDNGNEGHPRPHRPDDRSISVNNCHSSRREVEVLHDKLLRILEDPDIEPRDILVMAPDIGEFEPYIRAVFSSGRLRDLFNIGDRSLRSGSVAANAFSRLLEIGKGRFGASEVLELLSMPPIRERFAIPEEALPQLRKWVSLAGIRWGAGPETHEKFCHCPFPDFSWRDGLDRLLLGGMLELPENTPGEGNILPLDAAVGDLELLGKFAAFAGRLFEWSRLGEQTKTIAEWLVYFTHLLDEFFSTGRNFLPELASIRSGIDELSRRTELLHCGTLEIPADAAREMLGNIWDLPLDGGHFLRGKITFCSMVPMRSIPRKVVAVIGLSEGKFPRRDVRRTFDLMSRELRPCDRNRAAEDRYLFLEAIQSARKYLLLSYQGQSWKDNQKIPPAVPLGELLDYLKTAFDFEETKQALWPFDLRYFGGEHAFPERSFSHADFWAAKALATGTTREEPAILSLRPGPRPELPPILELRELEDFFSHPPLWYMARFSGWTFDKFADGALAENEPLELDSLEAYTFKRRLLDWRLCNLPRDRQLELLRKSGQLPVGEVGTVFFSRWAEIMEQLPESFCETLAASKRIPVEETVGSSILRGQLEFAEAQNLHYLICCSSWKWKYAIRFRLRHLLASLRGKPCWGVALLCGRVPFEWLELAPITKEEALKQWNELLECFRDGCSRPLPVMECASFQCASLRKTTTDDALRKTVLNAYCGSSFVKSSSDRENPVIRRLFGDGKLFYDDAFFQEFIDLAQKIYPPVKPFDQEVFL